MNIMTTQGLSPNNSAHNLATGDGGKYTVIGHDEGTGHLFSMHVLGHNSFQAFAVAAMHRPEAFFTVAFPGHLSGDDGGFTFPGETLFCTDTILEQTDIFGAALGQDSNMEQESSDEISQQHAWSITARLAALPPAHDYLPAPLAALVQESRELHPCMVRHADEASGDGKSPTAPRLVITIADGAVSSVVADREVTFGVVNYDVDRHSDIYQIPQGDGRFVDGAGFVGVAEVDMARTSELLDVLIHQEPVAEEDRDKQGDQ